MLIGIDMIGVQSPGGGSRESGRLGRQLVSALLAAESPHRYVLYAHDGLPMDQVPSARNALRVSLAASLEGPTRLRPTIQRVLDRNPDGLDWLVLLDPFHPSYGGFPPESPLDGVKVASMVTDLAPTRVDDRRLAPLLGHDAILAYSAATYAECRSKLPVAGPRIKRIGLAIDESWVDSDPSGPLCESTASELGRLGIVGPFLFANLASGADRSNLAGVLDAYRRLPLEFRQDHQLVIAGEVEDPWAAVAYLHDHGCAEGLVFVGSVGEPLLRTLDSRCAVFVSPSFAGASELSLVEAMGRGAALVAGRVGPQAEVVGEAGLLVDPSDPSEIAEGVATVLADVDLARSLRRKALDRSARFAWAPVVGEFLQVLGEANSSGSGPRYRFDRSHVARPRIALFVAPSKGGAGLDVLDERIARECLADYDLDLYCEPGDRALGRRPTAEFGGFDARQFARNDDILDYHAVVYVLPDVFSLKPNLGRLSARPGLVILRDETSLDRIEVDPFAMGAVADVEAEVACQRLHELFLTSSCLLVRSSRNEEAIRSAFPGKSDRVIAVPSPIGDGLRSSATRRLAGLIEACATDLPTSPGRAPGKSLGSGSRLPATTHWLLAASETDDSSLELR